ncbi:MAG: hypothetical protein LBK58_07170 [Prevotellaceae bacterium]|nr:hypothetical protein [Prevotellaceae bacterium]
MKSLEQKILEDYLVGSVKYKEKFYFYAMPVAWWILDYEKYSPSILSSKERRINFRNGVLVVTDYNIKPYLESIQEYKLTHKELSEIIYEIDRKYPEEGYAYLNFFIDFDKKEYINGFYDIELEDYLPDESWKGKFDEPLKYLPLHLRAQWQ